MDHNIKKSTIGDMLNKSVERAMGATSQSEKFSFSSWSSSFNSSQNSVNSQGWTNSGNSRNSVIRKNGVSPVSSPHNKSAPPVPWGDKSSGSGNVLQQFDVSMFDK